ncbi:MAG: protein translocase subunit SecD [Alphaproteobacteria bacterium]|nr:MAG: protein translocase subunit SecD [Alphaproteobacteria bacterium]
MLNFSRWKKLSIIGACLLGLLMLSPNFFSDEQIEGFPGWLPDKKINLGLDLQGGVHLLWEVGIEAVNIQELDQLRAAVPDVLRDAGIRRFKRPVVDGDAVEIRISDAGEVAAAIDALREDAAVIQTALGPVAEYEVTEAGGNRVRISYTEQALLQRQNDTLARSIEIIRRRIDEMGTQEPTIQRQGDDRILVQVPGIDDPDAVKELVGRVARLTFHLVDTNVDPSALRRGRVPSGSLLVYEYPDGPDMPGIPYSIQSKIMVDGADLTNAQAGYDQYNRPAVNFTFNQRGGKMFAEATRKNVGRPFAIKLDDEIVSAPRITEAILGGSGQITGRFTPQETFELAILLRAGALPAPMTVLEERTVGPGMGADAVAAGKNAAIIGMIAVLAFIALSYGIFGIAANIALLINLVLIGGALSMLGAVLTLPGIAGIVLTIGMAVDANVLVFERIREEVRAGRAPFQAVEMGYARAMSTILDANITTLIAAILLFQFGSGPVRGFAVTLAIGIVMSVFTAVIVTRLMVATWLRYKRPTTLSI